MKCKNCKNKIPKGMKFCTVCGMPVKRKKAGRIIIIMLICFALLLGAAAAYYFLIYRNNHGNNSPEEQAPVSVNTEEISVPDVDTGSAPEVRLTVNADNVEVGKQSVVNFTAEVPDRTDDKVIITDVSDNSVLTVLDKKRKKENGNYEYYGNYTFVPKESVFMRVRAYYGESFSPVGCISAAKTVTEEENKEFIDVTTGLGDYLESIDTALMSDEETLDAVESWLSNNEKVSEVTRDESNVYYVTNGGLSSYFTAEEDNPYVLEDSSATDHYTNSTDATEYYNMWEADQYSLRRSDEENINYLPADITITNNNTILMRPTYSADDGFQEDFFSDIINLARNSKHLSGGRVNDCRGAANVMDVIRNRELLDYGNIYLCAHGGYDSNYYFEVLDTTEKNEFSRFCERYSDIRQSSGPNDQSWMIVYYQSSETEIDENGQTQTVVHYIASLSARYLIELYQNYTFDNPIFWMVSCHGMQDTVFNDFLISRGAQCMVGSEESVYFGVWDRLTATVMRVMLEEDNDSAKLSSAWGLGVDNGICEFTYEGNDKITVSDYFNKYYRKVNQSISFDDVWDIILNHSENMLINDPDMIKDYLEYVNRNENWKNINVIRVYDRNENDKEKGSFDYSAELFNHVTNRVNNGDFTFGGHGTLFGTVKKGEASRTIHTDGSYEDAFSESDPLSYANVTAYRFLDQSFENKNERDYFDETTTGSDGYFELNDVDWGHYVLDIGLASCEGEYSIILTGDDAGGDIVVPDGSVSVKGYAQGYTDINKQKVDDLSNCEVIIREKESDSEVAKTSSGSDGYFEINGLDYGDYVISLSHEGYEPLAYGLSADSGYTYNYDKGYFILENSNTENDIVLVLDVSGSMAGDPLNAVKSAVQGFADRILGAEENNCRVAMVKYSNSAEKISDFTKYSENIRSISSSLNAGGGTNIEDGLSKAVNLLESGNAKKKHIVLMSDGLPNQGKQGSDLVSYADSIKDKGITIYTLGYFEDSSITAEGYTLMTDIASPQCRYNVSSVSEMSDFFDDMAQQLRGVKFYNATIECPVDVSVSYNGETLSSAEDSLCTRTSFGTLMFGGDENDRSKVLRLRMGTDYDIRITGTGAGTMDYTFSIPDSEGNYTDSRTFTNVQVSDKLVATTTLNNDKYTMLNLDTNGDGRVDDVLRAAQNSEGEAYNPMKMKIIMAASAAGAVILIILIIFIVIKVRKFIRNMKEKRRRRKAEKKKTPVRAVNKKHFCTYCGKELQNGTKFCTGCGKRIS